MVDTDAETETEGSERLDAHLQDIEDGCGCTEVWEHTSAAREAGTDDADSAASDD